MDASTTSTLVLLPYGCLVNNCCSDLEHIMCLGEERESRYAIVKWIICCAKLICGYSAPSKTEVDAIAVLGPLLSAQVAPIFNWQCLVCDMVPICPAG